MSEALPKGWATAHIDDIVSATGGSTPSKSDSSFWEGDIPWVSPKDMKTFDIQGSEDSVTTKALAKLTLVPAHSVLMVVRSGILSRTLPVAINAVPVTINQDMRAFGPKSGINARFLAWQIVAEEREILDKCSKDGTTVASIESAAFSAFPFKVAPRAEQVRIIEKLEELLSDHDAAVAELKAAQRKLASLRQSLLKAAVEGDLTADWRAVQGQPQESGAALLQRILTERRARWEQKQRDKYAAQGKIPPKGWQSKYPEPITPDTTGLPELPEGWVWATVETLGGVQLGRQRSPSKLTGSGCTPYVRAANITESGVSLDDILEMDFSESERANFALRFGDVLLTEASGSTEHVGRPAIWKRREGLYCFQNTVLRFSPIAISSQFAYYTFLAMQKLGVFSRLSGGWGSIISVQGNSRDLLSLCLRPLNKRR